MEKKLSIDALSRQILSQTPDISASDFVPLIVAQFPKVSDTNAAFYWYHPHRRLALGLPKVKFPVEFKESGKAPREKTVKASPKFEVVVKSEEEIAEIGRKNLERLRAVSKKFPDGKVAKGKKMAYDPEQVKSEVANIIEGLDSYEPPAFLTKSQVKELV